MNGRQPRVRVLCIRSNEGQALVEFLVTGILVLIPFFILIVTLGKYMDAKQKVEVAARYAAWERTVWHSDNDGWLPVNTVKADSRIQAETQARTFTKRQTSLSSDAPAAMQDSNIDPLLNYHYADGGRYEPILRSGSGTLGEYVSADTVKHEAPGIDGQISGAVSALRIFLNADQFDIDMDGTHTATVSVGLLNPARIPEFSGLDLTLERSVTLVTDNWNAGGPDHTRRRVEGLTPTAMLDDFVDIMDGLPLPGPLNIFDRLTPGHIDVDQVPEQYLETSR